MGMNVPDRNAGFARGQAQVWGFGKDTAIDSMSYGPPGAKIFYVDRNNAQAVDFGNLGEDPTVPLATVAAAVALCRSHYGDTIILAGNDAWQYAPHNRPLPIAESLVIPATKGGIRIVGASTNPFGVQWQAGADNEACITIHAIDVLIEGIAFVQPVPLAGTTGITGVWGGANFGENFTVRRCYFVGLDYGITTDYSWYCQIYSNYFNHIDVAAILNLTIMAREADFETIHDNTFLDCALAISLPNVEGNFIYNNRIFGAHGGALNFINTTGGGGNLVSDNWLSCTVAEYATTCGDGGTDVWCRNHCSDGETVGNP